MSLRYAMLGLLAASPSTGYDLTRRFEASLAHAWHASHSQIYPELARLQQLGLVEEVGQGARRSRTWAITEPGRAELRRWLVEEEPSRAQRSETALRWFLLPLVGPADRNRALAREIEDITSSTQMLRDVMSAMRGEKSPQTFAPTVELALRLNEVMEQWLREQADAT